MTYAFLVEKLTTILHLKASRLTRSIVKEKKLYDGSLVVIVVVWVVVSVKVSVVVSLDGTVVVVVVFVVMVSVTVLVEGLKAIMEKVYPNIRPIAKRPAISSLEFLKDNLLNNYIIPIFILLRMFFVTVMNSYIINYILKMLRNIV